MKRASGTSDDKTIEFFKAWARKIDSKMEVKYNKHKEIEIGPISGDMVTKVNGRREKMKEDFGDVVEKYTGVSLGENRIILTVSDPKFFLNAIQHIEIYNKAEMAVKVLNQEFQKMSEQLRPDRWQIFSFTEDCVPLISIVSEDSAALYALAVKLAEKGIIDEAPGMTSMIERIAIAVTPDILGKILKLAPKAATTDAARSPSVSNSFFAPASEDVDAENSTSYSPE